MKSLEFNGIRKSWLHLLSGRQKAPFAPRRNNLLQVPGMPGAYYKGEEIDVLYITQPVGFVVEDDEDALKKKDELAEWLLTGEPVELKFDDEPGRTYYAKIEGTIEDFNKFVDQRSGTLTFLCPDPFAYGEEKIFTAESDYFNIKNEGTAEAEPIFELEVKEPITFAMLQNQFNEYNMIGRDVSASEIAIPPKTSILNDPLNSLETWNDATFVDNGVISGTMATDQDGFYASSFGTGTSWHGPAKKKTLSEPLQDFEAQIHVENLNLAGGMGMIEVYFLDVNETTVAKIGIEDAWQSLARMQVKMQLGGPANRHSIYGEPQRASHWYDYRGIMRIARRGNVWTSYFAVVENGIYRYPFQTIPYIDTENKYSSRIAQIQIAIRKRPNAPATRMRVNHAYVSKLNELSDNQVPYIAMPGDIITFDHTNNGQIYINGEPYEDTILGADYFTLKKGDNNILAMPNNAFENIRGRYRERWL